MKYDKLTLDDIHRLSDLVYLCLPHDEAMVICPWLRRMEKSEALVPALWHHDSERIVLRDVRAGLERLMEDEPGDLRLEMTRAYALILGDWLWRMDQSKALKPFLGEDGSEQNVLWTLEVWLEHEILFEIGGAVQHGGPSGTVSWPGYEALVSAAREAVTTDNLRTN
jgi:hypothetical protein